MFAVDILGCPTSIWDFHINQPNPCPIRHEQVDQLAAHGSGDVGGIPNEGLPFSQINPCLFFGCLNHPPGAAPVSWGDAHLSAQAI